MALRVVDIKWGNTRIFPWETKDVVLVVLFVYHLHQHLRIQWDVPSHSPYIGLAYSPYMLVVPPFWVPEMASVILQRRPNWDWTSRTDMPSK